MAMVISVSVNPNVVTLVKEGMKGKLKSLGKREEMVWESKGDGMRGKENSRP